MPMSRRWMRRRYLPVLAAVALVAGAVVAIPAPALAAVAQPPSPVDPSPVNGQSYYLISQATGLQAGGNAASTKDGDNVRQSPRSFSDLGQRWAVTKVPSGNWLISNVGNGLCLDSRSAAGVTWTVQNRCASG